jgi:signal transduction histidine kinase
VVVVSGFSLIGIVLFGIILSGLFGAARAFQLAVTVIVPSLVMVGYWIAARGRLLEREAELEEASEIEAIFGRANGEFVAGVVHELTAHPERCSLKAEALAVAVDYRGVCPDLKVAVPDTVVVTDPHLLRHLLHVLVGNAVRHGGERVAIWAAEDGPALRLTVSDDGPGLPAEVANRLFDKFVDLAGRGSRDSWRAGTGLELAGSLSNLIGGDMTYKRDPNWTHFSVRLMAEGELARPSEYRIPLQAGVS